MTKRLTLRRRIESMVQAILNEVNERHPHSMDELLTTKDVSNTIRVAVTDNVAEPLQVIDPETSAFEMLRASLGVIFGERYGWSEETIDDMSLQEVFIALEHAMEYDAPSKKSVWKL